jgi:hypothetical protein
MKKLKLLLLCLPFSLLAKSQAGENYQINKINIMSFSVKQVLPANINNWMSTPGALILVAQKVQGTAFMSEPRMVVQIRSNGAVLCGNNAATGNLIDSFNLRTFNTADLTGILTNCHELKEGSYSICVQFFNSNRTAISKEVCKDFRVEAANTNTEYTPPTLITPENGKKFTGKELSGPVKFSWSPVVPKPNEPVTYRMKVWQLMQGQNGSTAMKSNQPIVTKDVDNLTQASISGIYTGPCKPPLICDYIWNVQAIDRNGKPMGNNNGMSEAYTFSVAEQTTTCTENLMPEDKKQISPADAMKGITFKWKPAGPGQSSSYRIRVWQLMQGQNGSAAMKTNKPIVTKDVDNLTEATVGNIYTGPCKPPMLCSYVWVVEMRNAAGQTVCTSEPTTFSVSPCSPVYELKWDSVACGEDGKVHVSGHIVITLPTGVTISQIQLTDIKTPNAFGINVSTNIILPYNLTASGINYPFSFIVNDDMCNKQLYLGYSISSTCASAPGHTSTIYCADSTILPCCTCTFCDQFKQLVFSGETTTATTTPVFTVNVSATITAPSLQIISFKAELISFIHNGKEECFGCNKDAQTFGNFTGGTFGSWGNGVFPLYGTYTTHHTLTWFSGTPGGTTNLAGSAINLTFTAPPLSSLSCCDDEIKFCIRYSFTDKDCRTCSFVKCYGPIKRKH